MIPLHKLELSAGKGMGRQIINCSTYHTWVGTAIVQSRVINASYTILQWLQRTQDTVLNLILHMQIPGNGFLTLD